MFCITIEHKSSCRTIFLQYFKLAILGTLGIPGYAYPKLLYQLAENFHVYLEVENQLHPHIFLQILQRYANYLFELLAINL